MSSVVHGVAASAAAIRPDAGQPWPMGASLTAQGANFAVFSAHATGIDLCLFSPDGRRETARFAMTARTGHVWHIHLAGLQAGQLYGFRADGPYAPEQGHRFNPHKLLLDPYAKAIAGRLRWSDSVMGYKVGSQRADLSFDSRDSAFAMPKSQLISSDFDWEDDRPPQTPMAQSVIYEAHVRSLTKLHPQIPEKLRGSYAALGHPALIAHLKRLGVTALELLPVHAYFDDRFLVAKGLTNHWGYNSVGFFALDPRHGSLNDFKSSVKALHKAGIEVLLDVVYNHSGEGDEFGPTWSFRGLDNRSYYRLLHGGRHYANDAGTGNTLDLTQGAVLQMVMDSLRHWVQDCHIDGFRFDLATVLGREAQGFDPGAGFFDALLQDPVLSRVKLIAEPWDIGPGGYQLGAFPHPFCEWNDKFRDGVRRFWKGDPGQAPELARRLLGSADRFDHSGRAATASVNYLAAHDGFTLADVVTYSVKRNFANGEQNRDGHDDNHSSNMGVEGPSDDPIVRAARAQRQRNLLASLFLSQGTPMLLAGDEMGHSQGGNNNAYAQDNETSWINWANSDEDLVDFTARLIGLRAGHGVLSQGLFLHGRAGPAGLPDVIWRRADGAEPSAADWHDPQFRCFGAELRPAASGPQRGQAASGPQRGQALYLVFNGGAAQTLVLPATAPRWRCLLDTSRALPPEPDAQGRFALNEQCVVLFTPDLTTPEMEGPLP